jgi:hypothetical protein
MAASRRATGPDVPNRAPLVVGRRPFVGGDLDEAKAEMLDRTAEARGLRDDLRELFYVKPTATDEAGPAARSADSAIRHVSCGDGGLAWRP